MPMAGFHLLSSDDHGVIVATATELRAAGCSARRRRRRLLDRRVLDGGWCIGSSSTAGAVRLAFTVERELVVRVAVLVTAYCW